MTTTSDKKGDDRVRLGRTGNRPIWGLWLSICVRCVHQLGVAALIGYLFFRDGGDAAGMLLWLTTGSGLLLCITEGARHREMYREISGVVTIGKCVLLGLGVHQILPQLPVILLVFVAASLAAHAPRQVRHRLVW